MRIFKHIAVIFAALFIILGIPVLSSTDVKSLFSGSDADAVSQASTVLPDQPSGEYIVLLNTERFPYTAMQWDIFFSGNDAGVIMDDISCSVANSDAGGIQLAKRFTARLPENQMRIKKEAPLLLASKADHGLFDVIAVSRELYEFYDMQTARKDASVKVIEIKGD